MEAAATYSRDGHQVDFIEEGVTKAPDLVVSDETDIYVECKRCSSVSQEDERVNGLHEAIKKSVKSEMSREGIVLVNISREISGEEAHNVDNYLPEESGDRDTHQISLPFGELFIIPFQAPGEPKPVEKHPPSPADTPHEFFEKYVSPAISSRLDVEMELDDFQHNNLQSEVQEGEENLFLDDPLFLGLLHETSRGRVKTNTQSI